MVRIIQVTLAMLAIAFMFLLVSCGKDPATATSVQDNGSASLAKHSADTVSVSVFATGLKNPRGLTFGPDGFLYVAEGGVGGTDSSTGLCEQVVPPVGPYKGSPYGARIVRIDKLGVVSTYCDSLPSAVNALGDVEGVSDVEFIGDQLYGLLAAGGCSHANPSIPNGVIKVNHDGSWNLVADLSAFYKANPVAHPETDDFEPDGDPYSMVAVRGDLYVVEANHGEVDRVSPGTGMITRLIDVSASQGHIVPTSIAYHGNFFIGNLGTFPITPGTERIFKVTPSGNIKVWIDSLTTVLGVTFSPEGRMYVLETSDAPGFPGPYNGKVLLVGENGYRKLIADSLSVPTAITYGPDGNLYVSNLGYGVPPVGMGQIVKITLPKKQEFYADTDEDHSGKGPHDKNWHARGKGD